VHHCDAVEDAFIMTDKVLTISFHHHAPYFFPGSGGSGGSTAGKTSAVNLPLHEGCSDSTFQPLFSSVLAEAYEQFRQDPSPPPTYEPSCLQSNQPFHRPSVVILQCGADALHGDPVGVFNLTTQSVSLIIKRPGWLFLSSLDLCLTPQPQTATSVRLFPRYAAYYLPLQFFPSTFMH
jgi:acetoin utilization deacetylase AcuC-like enzyme